jgi:hypothetical protein
MIGLLMLLAAQAPAGQSNQAIAQAESEQFLRLMVARTLLGHDEMARSHYVLGIKRACEIAKPAFEAAVKAQLPRWHANLVSAYATNVPTEVLQTALEVDEATRRERLKPYMPAVMKTMQESSTVIMIEAAKSVASAVRAQAVKVDFDSIDQTARLNEVNQAKADGSFSCGLDPSVPALGTIPKGSN